MKKLPVILALSLLSRTAHGEKVVSLQQMDLTDVPGKEGLMVTVEIAPGESVPKHRHNSDVLVYVLSGTIVTQVQDSLQRHCTQARRSLRLLPISTSIAGIQARLCQHDYLCCSLRIGSPAHRRSRTA
jgi:hypothetical protein